VLKLCIIKTNNFEKQSKLNYQVGDKDFKMSQPTKVQLISLQAAERRAFRLSTSQDGLYDIFFGVLIILLSFNPWLDENGLRTPWNVILTEGLAFLILLGVLLAKKFVVAPRIGQVRYGHERKRRMKRLAMGMLITFLMTVVLFGMTLRAIYFGEPIFKGSIGWDLPFDLVHTAAGIFIFGLFSVIGYMNDYARLYFYGFLFGLGYVVSTALEDITGNPFYWPWTLAGLVPVIVGLVLFLRFLRDYPQTSEPVLEVNGEV
jgi:MFS family permease